MKPCSFHRTSSEELSSYKEYKEYKEKMMKQFESSMNDEIGKIKGSSLKDADKKAAIKNAIIKLTLEL